MCDGVPDCSRGEDEEDCHSNSGNVHKKCIRNELKSPGNNINKT